jgi:hypothetical protein
LGKRVERDLVSLSVGRERERECVRSCSFVEREGLFAFEGDRRTAKMEDFDEENPKF